MSIRHAHDEAGLVAAGFEGRVPGVHIGEDGGCADKAIIDQTYKKLYICGMAPKPLIKRSRGNVFKDLGFPAEEADHLKIRSSLMGHLRQIIEGRGLSQAEAARLFGVTQPRVSDLVRGRIDLFSIDTLVDLLARAGVKVRLEVSASARRKSRVA